METRLEKVMDSGIIGTGGKRIILGGFAVSKYSIIISWSEEDQTYIVAVPELPGCMADGKTPIEAVENAEVIIQEWIECAMEDGKPIPEPSLFNPDTV